MSRHSECSRLSHSATASRRSASHADQMSNAAHPALSSKATAAVRSAKTFLFEYFIVDEFFMIKEDVRPLAPKKVLAVLSAICWVVGAIFFVWQFETARIAKTETTTITSERFGSDIQARRDMTCTQIGKYVGTSKNLDAVFKDITDFDAST